MEEEISLVELFGILKKRLGMIINFILVGVLLTAAYTFFIATPEYSATTQLLVSRPQESETIQSSDIDTNIQLINTYSDIIRNPIILDPVRDTLEMDESLEEFREQITVSAEDDSQVFSLEVAGDNPYDVAEVANTTADEFQNNLDDIMSVDNVSVISTAVPDTDPVSPIPALNLVIGLILGGMVGVGLAFLFEFLDDTVKDESFITDEIGWTSLGRISEMNEEELASHGRQEQPDHPTPDTRSARTRV